MRKFRLLVSKYGFSIVIVCSEIIAIFSICFYVGKIVPNLWMFVTASTWLVTILAIVNRSMTPESKVTWLIVNMLPVVGALFYLMFSKRHLSRREIKQLRHVDSMQCCSKNRNSHDLMEKLKELDKSAYGIVKSLLSMDRNADVYKGTLSRFFSLGEEMFEQILLDLRQSEKFIFLEYYIVEEGDMWNEILGILVDKARQGVEVKMLYDDIGCMATLPSDYTRKLRRLGIDAHRFNKVVPRATVTYNNCDHRKILVIDGQIGYTGGVNLADEYINKVKRFGHWKDGGIRLDGSAVKALTRLFLMNWCINYGEIEDFDYYHLNNKARVGGEGLYIPYGSGPRPMYKAPVGKSVYQNILSRATDYVYITTPYLIIDYDLTEDIKNAALRGVDVRIITPFIPDKKIIQLITRGSYPDLMEAGVRIFEYTPGFIHSKHVISDDIFGVVGTINFDYRSLVHHYENAVFMYKTKSIADMKKDFEEMFAVSRKIRKHTIRNTWYQRLIKGVVQLFAPML